MSPIENYTIKARESIDCGDEGVAVFRWHAMAQEEVEISFVRPSPCASIGVRAEADSVLKEAGGTWYYDYCVGITKNRVHKRLLSGPGASV
jgi:hypothetical protein